MSVIILCSYVYNNTVVICLQKYRYSVPMSILVLCSYVYNNIVFLCL